MSGEGRGHATRVRAIVDELSDSHQLMLFAPGDAYDLLAPAYKGTKVKVVRIPCLRFFYTTKGKLDYWKTVLGGLKYIFRFPTLKRKLCRVIQKNKPDLILTDFEPALPRAARKCGVPFLSVNHQHFLIINDLSALPFKLRLHSYLMSLVVRSYYQGEEKKVVSSFYFPPKKKKYKEAVQVGVILRPSVIAAPRAENDHLVVYLRKFATENIITELKKLETPVRLYGLGKKADDGNITYCEINEETFLRDLGTGKALICTAGNQLVGEALYLGKPVFAMPEPNNQEQYINAWFLKEEGTGDWIDLEEFTAVAAKEFLNKIDHYKANIAPEKYNGTPLALKTIEDFLSTLSK